MTSVVESISEIVGTDPSRINVEELIRIASGLSDWSTVVVCDFQNTNASLTYFWVKATNVMVSDI